MASEKKYKRKSIRLKDYDYSQSGAYFVTICTKNRECLFGEVVGEIAELSWVGNIAHKVWCKIPEHFNNVELYEFVVMPNHLHGIIFVANNVGATLVVAQNNRAGTSPAPTLGKIIGSFKSLCIHECIKNQLNVSKLWQRNYYEHIIRNDKELNRIREYIYYNPLKWDLDIENPTTWKNGKKISIEKYYKNIFEGREVF